MRVLTLLITLIMLSFVNAELSEPIEFPSSPLTPEDITQDQLTQTLTAPQNVVTGADGTLPTLTKDQTVQSALGDISGFTGKDLLKASDYLIGGTFESISAGNIPIYDLVGDSIVEFILDPGQKASALQFKNGVFQNAFKTTLSPGAKLRQFFRDTDAFIEFESTGLSSFIEEGPGQYIFGDGIFIYDNGKIREKITSKKPSTLTLDQTTGVKCVDLSEDAEYSYIELEQPFTGFTLHHTDKTYRFCKHEGSNSFDTQKKELRLQGKGQYLQGTTLVYEGLTASARMIASLLEGQLTFTGAGEANIYSGRFRITPQNNRIYFFYIEKLPLYLEEMSINNQKITLDTEGLHTFDTTNRIDALS